MVPASTTTPPLHSPCSIHGSAHQQSGIISEPLAVNSCEQYKNNFFFYCRLATAPARAVREQCTAGKCGVSQGPPLHDTSKSMCPASGRRGSPSLSGPSLLKTHCLHRKCPGQSVRPTRAPRPIWDASIFLA